MDAVFEKRSVIERETLKSLSQKKDGPGLLRLGIQLFLLGLSFLLPEPARILLGGFCMAFFFAPFHECLHLTAFASPILNRAGMYITGLLMGLSPTSYQRFHFLHHRHTHEEGDPELLIDPFYGGAWPRHRIAHLWALSGLAVLIGKMASLMGGCMGLPDWMREKFYPFLGKEDRWRVVMESWVILLFQGGMLWMVPGWWMTVVLGNLLLASLQMAEHTGLPPDAHLLSRARSFDSFFLLRFFYWNMNYHAEHHSFPGVPFHQLPALHQNVLPYLEARENSYLLFHVSRFWRGG